MLPLWVDDGAAPGCCCWLDEEDAEGGADAGTPPDDDILGTKSGFPSLSSWGSLVIFQWASVAVFWKREKTEWSVRGRRKSGVTENGKRARF